jgi:hypothetical protein
MVAVAVIPVAHRQSAVEETSSLLHTCSLANIISAPLAVTITPRFYLNSPLWLVTGPNRKTSSTALRQQMALVRTMPSAMETGTVPQLARAIAHLGKTA